MNQPATYYTVTVIGTGIHGLKRWLKAGLRSYGLKVIDTYEHTEKVSSKVSRCRTAQAVRTTQGNTRAPRRQAMDASKYAGAAFLSLDDVKDGKYRGEIAAVAEGGYNKLVLTFTNGLKFSLNATNTTEMIKCLGSETSDWEGESIELYEGEAPYQGKTVPSVRVTVLMREAGEKKKPPPRPKAENSKRGDMDDEIPF
jgi:hypothetical protein